MSQTPTPKALAAAAKYWCVAPDTKALKYSIRKLALAFDAHTRDLQATIVRLTRELGEARADGK